MRFKVPQNVQREDQIVAFLTLRHLIILGIGGGIAYTLYITLAKDYFAEVWAPPVVIISVITLAVAFLKIDNIPFLHYALLQIEFSSKNEKRFWIKMDGDVLISDFNQINKKNSKKEKKAVKKYANDDLKFDNINKLTEILDTHGNLTKKNE